MKKTMVAKKIGEVCFIIRPKIIFKRLEFDP